ncbi:hypothetical protein BRE01_59270 [Brevibacillus reuszeri]|uniref:DUF2953 domain-containing protein n=1 Tax=Brevibacillus reuszeri TaxID=54915 RepID=A0A0K9YVE8_9BACL|nr:DUF2953 domain-containing protein [Brevibacillus reuszeri]KNB72180.1 hypothetical protein ADS79_09670 [Brevibacillus reuszeri]MED1855809.1 DUF2953 domain-containing protein [Brevibacillus reuszeri]GED72225.1 hypothetical protein BRE01_59270 [Brevibacillus reuszeri]
MWGWLGITIIALLIVIMVTPVKITVYYNRAGDDDHVVLSFSVWFGLFHWKYEIPILLLKQTESGPQLVAKVEKIKGGHKVKDTVRDFTRRQVKKWYHSYRDLLKKVRDLQPLFSHLCKHIRCTDLEWHTLMGTGQAGETGALTGIIWGVKSMIIGIMSHTFTLHAMPKMSVQPVWNQAIIQTRFQCVLHFYLGHLLITVVRMAVRLRKTREHKWQTRPSEA